jgi:uncharacterized membrane protein
MGEVSSADSFYNIFRKYKMEFLAQYHRFVVHFPIAFLSVYFLFEVAGLITKKEYIQKASTILLGLGIFFSLIAVLTGNQAFEVYKNNPEIQNAVSIINEHEQFATISLFYFTGLFFIKIYLVIKKKLKTNFKLLLIFLGFVGAILIFLTGHYGGELVYKFGLGTDLFGK